MAARLSGRTALVTGAGDGIGKGIALELGAAGARCGSEIPGRGTRALIFGRTKLVSQFIASVPYDPAGSG